MIQKRKKLVLLTSLMSVFVVTITLLFAGGSNPDFIRTKASNSGNYSVSFNKTICGGSDYNTGDYTKESKLSVSKTPVYAHVYDGAVGTASDFARFKASSSAYIEFYIDSNVSFQEITGFSLTYNATYAYGDFDIYFSTDGSTYPASPNAQVRDASTSVSVSGFGVKKIKFVGLSSKYAYFNTITINYACGEAPAKSLTSIDVSGQTDKFSVGDTFCFGGTVTAHYNDGSSHDVTSSAIINSSGVDLSSAGEYSVSVSYSDEYGSANTSYSVTVSGSEPAGLTGTYAGTYTSFEFTSSTLGTYIYGSYRLYFSYVVDGTTITFSYVSGTNSDFGTYKLFSGSTTINSTGKVTSDTTITVKTYNMFDTATNRTFTLQ